MSAAYDPRKPCTETDEKRRKIESNLHATLTLLGEDPKREGLVRTPYRYAKAMQFLTSGYRTTLKEIVGTALFKDDGDGGIVLVRDVELFSLCEHHLLPFYGRAHVAYIPKGKIVGLSKIPRIVNHFARRLQVQERLTTQIGEALMNVLKPQGVAVVIEAAHMCMMMRGVEKLNSRTITSCMLGVFRENDATRKELLSLLGGLNGSTFR
ncbi:MAG: GTP cyclohydrolase I FolE [Bdellovibrionales bacterium]|nr:GTP cyclohydrolase I FolE [Bdellovibrionales bacterium]